MKLFNKDKNLEDDDMKIIDKDVGFTEDIFGMVCDMVAFEDHCDASYNFTDDEQELKDKDWMRNLRTGYLNLVSKDVKGTGWCKLKHLCRVAKGLQEIEARFLSVGKIEDAKICSKHWGETYFKFLEITGKLKGESENKTSA